jgi:hypothetical protein
LPAPSEEVGQNVAVTEAANPMTSWHLTIRHSLVYRSVSGVFIAGMGAWILWTSVFESVDIIGSIVFGAFGMVGLVVAVRLIAACVVLLDDRIVLRGAIRSRSVLRADIARVETRAFNGSSIATLRLWDNTEVRLPLAAQGRADEMRRLASTIETWLGSYTRK